MLLLTQRSFLLIKQHSTSKPRFREVARLGFIHTPLYSTNYIQLPPSPKLTNVMPNPMGDQTGWWYIPHELETSDPYKTNNCGDRVFHNHTDRYKYFLKVLWSYLICICGSEDKESYKANLNFRDSKDFSEPRGLLETISLYINKLIPYLDIQCSDKNYSKDILKISHQPDVVSCVFFVLDLALRLCASRGVMPKETVEEFSYIILNLRATCVSGIISHVLFLVKTKIICRTFNYADASASLC